MVGLVIVSHSHKLAEGVAELARGMAGEHVRIATAGGMDAPGHPMGTDPALVLRAIDQAYGDDGVVVLMDLGSAVLSAEMALDFMPEERRSRIRLCEAPLVEGAISAAVQAKLGSPIDRVVAEARGALQVKLAHLGVAPESAAQDAARADREGFHLRLRVPNPLGLHARPAARFVQTAARFEADLRVVNLSKSTGPVSAKSVNGVATLSASQGDELDLIALGQDAREALDAIQDLADDNFGDEAGTRTPTPLAALPGVEGALTGLPASPGVAIGPTARVAAPRARAIAGLDQRKGTPEAEWAALNRGLAATAARIQESRAAVLASGGGSAAEIFDAHLLFLNDPALLDPARRAILEDAASAGDAWARASDALAEKYRAMANPYLRVRAADVDDVREQVLAALHGGAADTPRAVARASIVLADDLSPSEMAKLGAGGVLGICTAKGTPTSHSAILARALGIPTVVGLGEAILALPDGTPMVMDGAAGVALPNPSPDAVGLFEARAAEQRAVLQAALASSLERAVTRDGKGIEVMANIGSASEAAEAVAQGAEGVGLFRTEFLFLGRPAPPSEDEQHAAMRSAAEIMGSRPVVIRTLDVGGDKPPSFLDLGHDPNPFLGYRAIRVCLDRPELFRVQLRAIARVAAEFNVRVMFPMIATLDEWRRARALYEACAREVDPVCATRGTQLGIMVEIPAAALTAERFAGEVDFFSIGTNDLTQYTLAAERGNARVANLGDALHPAVLTSIGMVCEAAVRHGKWVGVCGELAGDPVAIPVLIGLGVTELSMSARAIPPAKQVVRATSAVRAGRLAQRAIACESAQDVRVLLRGQARP